MSRPEKAKIVKDVFVEILDGNKARGEELLVGQYPHKPFVPDDINYNVYTKCRIFFRDTFLDRYSGQKLLFPPVLLIISKVFPEQFPFHPEFKTDACHIGYWEFFPTINHILPIGRGGLKEDINLVTTSLLVDSAKSHWTMEELGWLLKPKGDLKKWDGLLHLFENFVESNDWILEDRTIKEWHRAAKQVSAQYKDDGL